MNGSNFTFIKRQFNIITVEQQKLTEFDYACPLLLINNSYLRAWQIPGHHRLPTVLLQLSPLPRHNIVIGFVEGNEGTIHLVNKWKW